jgi:hypothetical protein
LDIRRKKDRRKIREAADRNIPLKRIAERARNGFEFIGVGQQAAGFEYDHMTGLGQNQALCGLPDEQLKAELLLEFTDRGGDRSLASPHPRRRLRDATGLGDRHKSLHGSKRKAFHVFRMTVS